MSNVACGHLLREYLAHLEDLDRSPHTIRAERGNLRRFLGYLADRGIADVRAVTREHVWEYATMLVPRALAAHTKALKLTAIRLFFRWLRRRHLILVDPATVLPRMKEPERLPRALMERHEVNLVLAQPELWTLAGFRDRTMLEVLYATGVRAAELLALAVADVDLVDGLLRVNQGKGRKDRIVPLGTVAGKFVAEYLRAVRPRLARGSADGPLFVAGPGRRMPYNTLARRIRAYALRAGVKTRVTAHVFRHTCATEMLRGGSSIRHVQELLGHANVSTTQVYARVLPLDLVAMHARCHPLERGPRAAPAPPVAGAALHRRRTPRRMPEAPGHLAPLRSERGR
jgi:integrase/recombinase XerD